MCIRDRAATLQSDGALDRERIVKFLDECAALVVSDATVDEVSAAAPGAGEGLLLHLQLEFMEHMGIDRNLGVAQMDPKALVKKYPGDGALLGQLVPPHVDVALKRCSSDAARQVLRL